jgi:hypothetical protein
VFDSYFGYIQIHGFVERRGKRYANPVSEWARKGRIPPGGIRVIFAGFSGRQGVGPLVFIYQYPPTAVLICKQAPEAGE